jgi:hypothetical protein
MQDIPDMSDNESAQVIMFTAKINQQEVRCHAAAE